MTRGGKREGAGRKRGAEGKKTAGRRDRLAEATAIVLRELTPAAAEAMTPIEVVRWAMKTYVLAGDTMLAHACAMDLMPYCLPKLIPAPASPSDMDPAMMTASQRAAEIRQLQAKPRRTLN
jgi:hypothetical protein